MCMMLDRYVLDYVTTFLTVDDKYSLSNVNKYFKSLIFVPENCGKMIHLSKLKKNFSMSFLMNCVENYTQALLLFNTTDTKIIEKNLKYVECRNTKKMFRKITYTTCLKRQRSKYLRVS